MLLSINASRHKAVMYIFQRAFAKKTRLTKSRLPINPIVNKPLALENLVLPVKVPPKPKNTSENVDEFMGNNLKKNFISMILDQFIRKPIIQELAEENYITGSLYYKVFQSFREHCLKVDELEPDLAITLLDIRDQGHSIDMIFPFFLAYAQQLYPHLECMDELKSISDLTLPHNWFPLARSIHRKIIFHAGPTNSGKTYQALESFKEAKTGVYCGPLRLLASEIYHKLNNSGHPCDLITGEDRRYSFGADEPCSHTALTVEMLSVEKMVDVAVIDEIQMIRDEIRGAAFTRALLGVPAEEVHLCGEEAAINIVMKILDSIGEHVEVKRYKRKSSLVVSTHGLKQLKNLEAGDCVISFSRENIFKIAKDIREMGRECAIIYGDLPASTKLAQANKFNDPDHPCKILVATDAIGMGLNLNIKRIIFSTLIKSGKLMPAHFARQIAGRAGRFGLGFSTGTAMAMSNEDTCVIKSLLSEKIENIQQAGIAPTFDQIEMFSYQLPHCSFSNMLDILISICSTTEDFFLCQLEDMRKTAIYLEKLPLALRDRYTFCLTPFKVEHRPVLAIFLKIVSRYCKGLVIDYEYFYRIISHLLLPANTLRGLDNLNDASDAVIIYLWLSYRFPDFFPDAEVVRDLDKLINNLVEDGIKNIINSRLNPNKEGEQPDHVDILKEEESDLKEQDTGQNEIKDEEKDIVKLF